MKRIISFLYAILTLSVILISMSAVTVFAEEPSSYTAAYEDEYTGSLNSNYTIVKNEEDVFEHDTANGIVSIGREKIYGERAFIERSFKATKNYDIEFRLKKDKVDEALNQSYFVLEIYSDTRRLELSIHEEEIGFYTASNYGSGSKYIQRSIPYSVGYDWFQIKAEVRDTWVTWYIKKDTDTEYKELIKHRIFVQAMDGWRTAVGMHYSAPNMSCKVSMDWQKYTPYFDDESSSSYAVITSPTANEVFTEGDVITFSTTHSLGYLATVKYFLNGVEVGSGSSYTFEDAKPGIYRLISKVTSMFGSSTTTSAERIFIVEKASPATDITHKLPHGLGIALVGEADDKWYTYKIVVGDYDENKSFADNHDEFVEVYRKERGAADSEYKLLDRVQKVTSPSYTAEQLKNYDYLYKASFTTAADVLDLGYYNARLDADLEDKLATKYSIDNLQFSNDDLAYSGYVSNTDAEIFVDSKEEIEAVVLASYDENNVLKDIDFAELNGGTNFADLNIKAGSVTKLYMWNKITAGKPILTSPIEF